MLAEAGEGEGAGGRRLGPRRRGGLDDGHGRGERLEDEGRSLEEAQVPVRAPLLERAEPLVERVRAARERRVGGIVAGSRDSITGFAPAGRAFRDSMIDLKKRLQDEIHQLEYELKVHLPKEILKAREHGDLRENAEYKAAKERQSFLQARARSSTGGSPPSTW